MNKIINAHVHMIEIQAMLKKSSGQVIPAGIAVYENIEEFISVVFPETLIAQMDEAGVEQSVLFAVNAPIPSHVPAIASSAAATTTPVSSNELGRGATLRIPTGK